MYTSVVEAIFGLSSSLSQQTALVKESVEENKKHLLELAESRAQRVQLLDDKARLEGIHSETSSFLIWFQNLNVQVRTLVFIMHVSSYGHCWAYLYCNSVTEQ